VVHGFTQNSAASVESIARATSSARPASPVTTSTPAGNVTRFGSRTIARTS
jgi:hypothetical protein